MSSSTIIVNLFAGPGAGKSTMAAGFAKELVWEGRFDALSNSFCRF